MCALRSLNGVDHNKTDLLLLSAYRFQQIDWDILQRKELQRINLHGFIYKLNKMEVAIGKKSTTGDKKSRLKYFSTSFQLQDVSVSKYVDRQIDIQNVDGNMIGRIERQTSRQIDRKLDIFDWTDLFV